MSDYGIKAGYTARDRAVDYLDAPDTTTWQPDVYAVAEMLALTLGVEYLLDYGCGSGGKLLALTHPFKVLAVDKDPRNLALAAKLAEERDHAGPGVAWLQGDVETGRAPAAASREVCIASDIIEHLRNPTQLLELMRHAKGIVISTPERDLIHGKDHMGPPPNSAHVREWNQAELLRFVADTLPEQRWLSYLTRSNDRDNLYHTTLMIGWRR